MIHPVKWKAALSLLDPDQLATIHRASLTILTDIGVVMPLGDVRYEVLEAGGARVDRKRQRVRFSPEVVENALKTAPAAYTLFARDPANNLPLDGTQGLMKLRQNGTVSLSIKPASGRRLRCLLYS